MINPMKLGFVKLASHDNIDNKELFLDSTRYSELTG